MTQTELFPMSAVDIATAFLDHFEDECEKRLKAVISAKDKLLDAQKLRDMAEAELRRAQDHVPSGPIANAAEALKAAAQANGFGVTLAAGGEEVVVCEPPEVDPVTGEVAANTGEKMEQGEVAPTTVSTTVERTCPECDGYGRLPDKTGGGHHRCRECDGTGKILVAKVTPVVLVAWPGVHDMRTVEVGPLTRFGELAAGYLASLSSDDPRRADDFTDYRIVDVDAGSERDPHAVITASDYSLMFSVEAPVAAEVAP